MPVASIHYLSKPRGGLTTCPVCDKLVRRGNMPLTSHLNAHVRAGDITVARKEEIRTAAGVGPRKEVAPR